MSEVELNKTPNFADPESRKQYKKEKAQEKAEQRIEQRDFNDCETQYLNSMRNRATEETKLILYDEKISQKNLNQPGKSRDQDNAKISANLKVDIAKASFLDVYQPLKAQADRLINKLHNGYNTASDKTDIKDGIKLDKISLFCSVADTNSGEYIKNQFGTDPAQVSGNNPITTFIFLSNNFLDRSIPDPASIDPELIVSYSDQSIISIFKPNNFRDIFDYKINGAPITSTSSEHKEKILDLLKTDVMLEWKEIVKNVMKHEYVSCNRMKETPKSIMEVSCESASYAGELDYLIQLFTCHQLFELSKKDAFCPLIEEETIDIYV